MKHLILAVLLLPTLAFAQRGGARNAPQNVMLSCNIANPTGTYCGGYEYQFCAVDTSASEGKLWRCSPSYHTWVKVGEIDSTGAATTVAFADSLTANGANCNSGSAPLGVSATGAAEGCFAVQPLDAELTAIAALSPTNGKVIKGDGVTWIVGDDNDSGGGGGLSFDAITSGTNTVPAAMLVGNGSSLGATGSGTISATTLACTTCVDMATELGTFSSADIIGRCSDESGTGAMLFGTAPTMTNPVVGTQAANDSSTKAASTAYVQAELTAYASDTVTFTNKTLDAEAAGNSVVIPTKAWLPAAGCQGSTATSFWDSLTANPATAACLTGSNTQKGVLDFDPTTNEFAQQTVRLPSDWSGSVDVTFIYISAGAGNVIWGIQTACVADGESTDPSFVTNTSTVTDASNASATTRNSASITGIATAGCALGELMFINVYRDAASGSDTMTANDARLIGVELTMRRSM